MSPQGTRSQDPRYKATFAKRLRYRFDRSLSHGPLALGVWLAGASFLFVLAMTLLIGIFARNPGLNLPQLFYTILLQAMVPNPIDATSGPWGYLIAMIVVTIGGLLMFSIFIGIFATAIDDRVQSLRKGRSLVLESNHTVILGWSAQIFTVISELVIANANQRNACIAILADMDKIDMEDEIKAKVGDTHSTRIVCRSGDPMDLADLDIVSPNTARSIIVLATHAEYHDAEVIKTVLALVNNPDRRAEPYHIVGSLRNPASQEIARLVSGQGEALLFRVDNLIARITAQTCRQTGLSIVYEELLDFEGDEIYFKQEPALTGSSFGEALFRYETSAVMGIISAQRGVLLNPPMDTILAPDDMLIAISADDDTITLLPAQDHHIDESNIHSEPQPPAEPEHTLILGWNRRAPRSSSASTPTSLPTRRPVLSPCLPAWSRKLRTWRSG
jgi:ion channel POLLUX/CASTOR